MRSSVLVLVVSALTVASPVPSGTTTRSSSQIGDTIKRLTNQLAENNATSPDFITLDTRTPPKIKQHAKKKTKEPIENSHAGVAIPVREEDLVSEQTTKKVNFYKVEKPTTNSGLSTWILLSGQTTSKPSRKPLIKPNVTLITDSNKPVKPVFKKRSTTTTTTTSTTSTTTPPSLNKLSKIKASLLTNAKKVTTTPTTTMAIETTTTTTTTLSTNSSSLPVEAKDGETELNITTEKKTRRPSTIKRKKNKNRRRRPSEKSDNTTTKIDKPIKASSKEKPIGTQLYNYLSREVMPTVGVGLAGLMVAAGLASYFLYPFGAARRSYEIDRRDKDPYYYYSDDYSGGIAEEEAIGKVIAGMSSNSLYGTNFKTPTSRHSFNNRRIVEQSTTYTVAGEEATPAAVPEHGPRNLKVRRRRNVTPPDVDEGENEIDGTISDSSTTDAAVTITPVTTSTIQPPNKFKSFMETLKQLLHLKIHLGLQLLQNATQAISKYVSNVQRRLDENYNNSL